MTRGDLLFLDTNVLLSATVESRPDHRVCMELFRGAPASGVHLVTIPQVFREYLVVATRPREDNGLGMSVTDALHNIGSFRMRVHLLPEAAEVTDKLASLIERLSISGKHIHDANLIAAMQVHRVGILVSANSGDFARFERIELLTPEAARAGLPSVE